MSNIFIRNGKTGVEETIEMKNFKYSEILGHHFNVANELEAYKAAYILARTQKNIYVLFDFEAESWLVGYFE